MQTETPPLSGCFCSGRGRTWRPLTIALLLAAVAGAGLTGCSIDAAKKKKLLNRIQPPQPVLAGAAVYAGDVLTAESWLGPCVRLRKAEAKAVAAEGRGPDGPRAPEPGRAGPAGTAGGPFVPGGKNYSPEEVESLYGHENFEYLSPPRLALIFKFANAGAQPITFAIADVNSSLGDFAPRPETLTLAPGQTGSLDPMLSNLDANFEELDVTLTLRIGGKKETQILKLRRSQEPAAAPHEN